MVNFLFVFTSLILISFGPVISQESTSINFRYISEDKFNVEMLKFYISNIQLKLKNEEIFIEENSYHLIDISEAETFNIKVGLVNPENIESIQFDIGTDSITNVSGILDGDLDPIKGMYWAWNSGYINFKLEGDFMQNDVVKPIELHIGGYDGNQATIQTIEFNIEEPSNHIVINVNPTSLLKELDLESQSEVMIPGDKAVAISKLLPLIFYISE